MTAESKDMLHGIDHIHLSSTRRAQANEALRNSEIILSWIGALIDLIHVGPRHEKAAA